MVAAQHDIQQTLASVFGYQTWRPLQKEVVENVMRGNDTLVIMPTGGGKSLCYQLPALLHDGLTVVVSPLIALMQDQVTQLEALGVAAVFLNSSLDSNTYRANMLQVREGTAKLLYVAPETLLTDGMLHVLDTCNISALVIDEAHCISQWGHDFRPDYRRLMTVRYRYPKAVCMALTATATPRVQEDIRQILQFGDENAFVASFDRPNLHISVEHRINPLAQTINFINAHKGQSGIIYCNTRKQVESVHDALVKRGITALPYHGGMASETRTTHQREFIRDDVDVMVATIAFGMGINKSDIRYVLHHDLPNSMEQYYQQIGRAGRDGLPADCLLLFSDSDVSTHMYHINNGSAQEASGRMERLNGMVRWAEAPICRRKDLLGYFGEQEVPDTCEKCDNCLREDIVLVDLTVQAQKFLSCVYRTGEKFGMMHVINVLRGSEAQSVIKWGHNNLKTHGIGRDTSTAEWKRLGRQFLQRGLVEKELERSTLQLTDTGVLVLTGKEKFMGSGAPAASIASKGESADYNYTLFEKLRVLRKKIADERGVPPYVIFGDKSLREMAVYFPQSLGAFSLINGVGRNKLDQYGNTFVALIRDYCIDNNIAEKPNKNAAVRPSSGGGTRHINYGDAYVGGNTIPQIAESFGVTQQTVIKNLEKYAADGHALDTAHLREDSTLSAESQDAVIGKFLQLGDERLRPIFDAFNETIGYDQLTLMRLIFRLEADK